MRIDLHTHSNRSDGTDCPWQLVHNAKRASLDVVAITDHDTTEGWIEARAAGHATGVGVVCGIELSVKNAGRSEHMLVYEPDPDHSELVGLLARTNDARRKRIPAMVARIAEGLDEEKRIDLADVERIANGGTLGRPHIATALVDRYAVDSIEDAFKQYLEPGCPTYIPRWSPQIEDALNVVARAGGAAVLAHPLGRGGSVDERRLAELKKRGLAGVEVDHQEHDQLARAELRGIADGLGLIATGSSDYHGLRKKDHDLGCNMTSLEAYERIIALTPQRLQQSSNGRSRTGLTDVPA